MFEPRIYREDLKKGRFQSFSVSHRETDLWIGVNKSTFGKNMEDFALNCVKRLRRKIELYAEKDKGFLNALTPHKSINDAPQIIKKMCDYGRKAQVGPMASVAGTFAQEIGILIENEFDIEELVIENGGDIYMNITEPVVVSVYAGKSPLSKKIGLTVLPQFAPLGICTSSGTVGHSLSFGKADAVVVACREVGLADAYATSLCNKIRSKKDIQSILNSVVRENEIISVLIVLNDEVGIKGVFPFEVLGVNKSFNNS